ncbi:hypothetical protein AMJ80_11620 [bacterium SM23_31]|nr:MAG: hypothetical protein AMJ80_11620 [bacterium SM23_31]
MPGHKYITDYPLLIVILVLVAIGIVMVYSASFAIAEEKFDETDYFLKKHVIRACIGLAVMSVLVKIDYRNIRKLSKIGLFCAIVLLVYLLVKRTVTVNGAMRWIDLGLISFQPSELAKFALVFYIADTLDRKQDKLDSFTDGYLPPLIIAAGVAILILVEPDFSSAVIIAIIAFMMLFLGKVRIHHLICTCIAALPIFAMALYSSPYRLKRLLGFLNPGADPLGDNYQINQSLISLGSGGFFGVGIGHSKEKLLYLPEPFTDFIFSILGEEMGFIGTMFILVLFFVILWRGLTIAYRAPDLYGSLLAAGITLSIVIVAFINIGVVCGMLPTTGLPIPFISYGGSSLLLSLGACGVLLNIAKHQKVILIENAKTAK